MKKLSKVLGWDDIKFINLEDVVENDSIKKSSTKNDFLILVTKGTKKWKEVDSEKISELQKQLLENRYFITYSNLKVVIKTLESESLLTLEKS